MNGACLSADTTNWYYRSLMGSARPRIVLVLALMLPWFPACSAPAPSPGPPPTVVRTPTLAPTDTPAVSPTPAASAGSAAAADLDNLLSRLESTHPEPWHG